VVEAAGRFRELVVEATGGGGCGMGICGGGGGAVGGGWIACMLD
jgi:hypothetical protein